MNNGLIWYHRNAHGARKFACIVTEGAIVVSFLGNKRRG